MSVDGPVGRAKVLGCLLGGAVGDAIGSPLEFLSLAEIARRWPHGLSAGLSGIPRPLRFTDDTQMTLFTAEGLIRALVRGRCKGMTSAADCCRNAYLRWLHTQGEEPDDGSEFEVDGRPVYLDGWLWDQPVLAARMAPGMTCLAALRGGGEGTTEEPVNHSKGCGTVMRSAPFGLVGDAFGDPYEEAVQAAATTHGHPNAWTTAGALAVAVQALARDDTGWWQEDVLRYLYYRRPDHREALASAREAFEAARQVKVEGRSMTAEDVSRLGEGWVAEEALAIALACVAAADSFEEAVLPAAAHGGDSDSTAAIAGNLAGALWGVESIPPAWLADLEGRSLIEEVANDLWEAFAHPESLPQEYGEWDAGQQSWWDRYPGR